MSVLESKLNTPKTLGSVSRSSRIIWWSLYVGFVVYGSLVPLDFHYLPWDQALAGFTAIKLLDVGAQGRADWVSNGVLYVPVGFLTVNLLIGQKSHSPSVLHFLGSLLFSLALAISVEYVQLYFPARTVSLNDLIAEFIGAIIGAAIAYQWVDRFRSLLTSLRGVSLDRLLTYLLEFYAFLYLAFSVFPFDFMVSADEFEWKRYADSWGWFIAKDFASNSNVTLLAKILAEILAVIPLGLLWARLRSGRKPGAQIRAITAGLGLGLSIEIIQFFLFSGISQGLSVLTRALGLWVGALIWNRRRRSSVEHLAGLLRQYASIVVITYVFALLLLTGWLDHPWVNIDTAIRVFSKTKFLPFYYHYYTTEQAALLSLTAVALMYAPVGIFTWSTRKTPAAMAFLIAALLSFGIETSKLFLEGLHPDPTNILIAAASAWSAARLAAVFSATLENTAAEFIEPYSQPDKIPRGQSTDNNLPSESPVSLQPLSRPGMAILGGGLLLVAWGVATFPVFSGFLGIFLAGYGVLLWGRPHLMLALVPAAIVLLDFAPWTGRFFFDEFDMLLLITVTIGYLRTSPVLSRSEPDNLYVFALWLFGLSYLCGTLMGLLPWKAIDANTFTHYYSPFNSIRVAKGAFWAFLLYGLCARFASAGQNVGRLFALGMVGGVAGTVFLVIWERFIFPGVFNFSDVYRVTGPFSQMHIGGADLETYLTVGAPFLVMLLIDKVSIWVRIASGLILLGATYSVMVTFSRVGYVGYGVALVLAIIAATRKMADENPSTWLRRGTLALVLLFTILGIAVPIYYSQFAQERMALVGADLDSRQNHWRDALKMRDNDWTTTLFGMGIGRYPDTHFWRSDEARAAPHWLGSEEEKDFLRLGAGNPLYVEQIVSVTPGKEYTVEINVRSNKPNAQLTVSICEKWLLTSARCSSEVVKIKGDGTWQHLRVRLASGEAGQGPWYASRPVKFSLYNSSPMATIDLDEVKLTDESARSLIANGNFSKSLDHWFFSVDNDLPWHVWSLPVQILFDQGWLGVAAFAMFMGLGVARAGRKAWIGNIASGSALAASVGFIVIGVLDSLIDSPRLLLLFLLIICIPSLPELIQFRLARANKRT